MNTMVQDKIYDRITKALFPSASNPHSQIIMAATPVSPTDLINRIWTDGGSSIMLWEYVAIQRDGTILDYNLQNLEQLLKRREVYSKRAFLQEVLLHADVEIDRIFTWNVLEKSKDPTYSYAKSFQEFYYKDRTDYSIMGNDYSFSTSDTSDYNSFASLAWTTNIFKEGCFRLFDLFYKQVMSIPEQISSIVELYKRNQIDVIYSESNGMQTSISDQLINIGLNVEKMNTTNKFKMNTTTGIPVLASLMEFNKLKFPYKTKEDQDITDKILTQFYNMIVIEKRGRVTKFEASAGNHDDIVLSISQAVLGSKLIDSMKLLSGDESAAWNEALLREKQMQLQMAGGVEMVDESRGVMELGLSK